jgi:hypothetical protein
MPVVSLRVQPLLPVARNGTQSSKPPAIHMHGKRANSFFKVYFPINREMSFQSLTFFCCSVGEVRNFNPEIMNNAGIRQSLQQKLLHYTPRRRLGWERRYSSYSFSTSALDVDEWSASRPGRALARGKGPLVPFVQKAGWAPEPICNRG